MSFGFVGAQQTCLVQAFKAKLRAANNGGLHPSRLHGLGISVRSPCRCVLQNSHETCFNEEFASNRDRWQLTASEGGLSASAHEDGIVGGHRMGRSQAEASPVAIGIRLQRFSHRQRWLRDESDQA